MARVSVPVEYYDTCSGRGISESPIHPTAGNNRVIASVHVQSLLRVEMEQSGQLPVNMWDTFSPVTVSPGNQREMTWLNQPLIFPGLPNGLLSDKRFLTNVMA
ncbi:hypothetical protein J6590_016636 [Homalodisca vitripennis]|nr:hypothetical protein J6590_016636 [Homalodisca vitripennis]